MYNHIYSTLCCCIGIDMCWCIWNWYSAVFFLLNIKCANQTIQSDIGVKYMYLPRQNVYTRPSLRRGLICSCVQMAVQTWRVFWCFCGRWHGRPSPWEVRGLLPLSDLWPKWALLHWYRLSALREEGGDCAHLVACISFIS